MKIVSIFFLSITFSLLVMAAVFGQNQHEKLQEIQKQIDAIAAVNMLDEKGSIAASAWPIAKTPSYFFSMDVIYWKAFIGGSEFVTTNNTLNTQLPIVGSIKSDSLDWNWGLKAAIGKVFDYDQWGVVGEWTYFNTNGSSKVHGGVENALIPLRGSYAQSIQRAYSWMNMDFMNLDINLCRYYFTSSTLAFKPRVGIKNTWNKLQQQVFYSQGASLLGNLAYTLDKSKMWGIGPNAGIDTTWYLGKNFSILGLFSVSTLYSYFRVNEKSIVTTHPELSLQLTEKHHRFIPNLQWRLGLGWNRYFSNRQRRVDLSLAYESLYYFRLNQMFTLSEFQNTFRAQGLSEDISMYGVTFNFQYSF
ncbi:MAG: Lpg1974 family pore-forming outer membrane protein [Chlamydiota bacterium]